jgi:hypothetical protein
MPKNLDQMQETKRLMSALVSMKPKQHEDMKVGKTGRKKKATPTKRDARARED